MPVVLTEPLTDLSSPTVIEPVPFAEVWTGGTSSAPVRLIFIGAISSTAPETKILVIRVAAASAMPGFLKVVIMLMPPLVCDWFCKMHGSPTQPAAILDSVQEAADARLSRCDAHAGIQRRGPSFLAS